SGLVRSAPNDGRARTKDRRATPLDACRQPFETPLALRRDHPCGIHGINELVGQSLLARIDRHHADATGSAQPNWRVEGGDDPVLADRGEIRDKGGHHRRPLAAERRRHQAASKAAAAGKLVYQNPFQAPSRLRAGLAAASEQRMKMEMM